MSNNTEKQARSAGARVVEIENSTSPKAFYVTKEVLLGIAGFVWCAAGFNIVRIGVLAYAEQSGALPIGRPARGQRRRVPGLLDPHLPGYKHTDRIVGYGNARQPFWRFFDRQAFIIMAVMMTAGISLRAFSLVPSWFIASFYTGLGIALFGAGVGFLINPHACLARTQGRHAGGGCWCRVVARYLADETETTAAPS